MTDTSPPLPTHVTQNIEAITQIHTELEGRVGRHQRTVEQLTWWVGQPWTFTTILGLILLWCGLNTFGRRFGIPQVDAPPFQWLQMMLSVSSLLVATMVLTRQNRFDKRATRRENLGLQVNLVAEQKIAKLISLLEELRRDLPTVPDRVDPVATAMEESVDPNAVMQAFDRKSDPAPEERPRTHESHVDENSRPDGFSGDDQK